MGIDIDIDFFLNDMSNYRHTNKKQYVVDVTMPLIGTQIEFNQLSSDSNLLHNLVTTVERPFVITGLLGEKYIISKSELFQGYTLSNGTDITDMNLNQKVVRVYKGNDLGTTYTVMYPLRIKSKKSADLLAVQVPSAFQDVYIEHEGESLIVNKSGISHGFGDYVVRDIRKNIFQVINGILFPLMYNMKMFPNKRVYLGVKPIRNKEYKELDLDDMLVEVSDIPKVVGTRGVKRGSSNEQDIERGIIYRYVIKEVCRNISKHCLDEQVIRLSELKLDGNDTYKMRYVTSLLKIQDNNGKTLRVGRLEFEPSIQVINNSEVLCCLYRVVSNSHKAVERMFSCTTKGLIKGLQAICKDILSLIG